MINLGNRQKGRLRAGNVIDLEDGCGKERIKEAILKLLTQRRTGKTAVKKGESCREVNPYRGGAGKKIASVLAEIALDDGLLNKDFAFPRFMDGKNGWY